MKVPKGATCVDCKGPAVYAVDAEGKHCMYFRCASCYERLVRDSVKDEVPVTRSKRVHHLSRAEFDELPDAESSDLLLGPAPAADSLRSLTNVTKL